MFLKFIISFCVFFSYISIFSQTPISLLEKAEKLNGNIPSYSKIELVSIRPRYTKKITLRSWRLDNNYSIVEIISPFRDSGMVYMKAGKKLLTYSPKTKRTINLPSSMLAQGWMGTDAQFDNILGPASLSKDFTHQLELPATINGEPCHFIRCFPLPKTAVAHDHIDAFLNKKKGSVSRLVVYNRKGTIIQQIDFLEYKEADGVLIPSSIMFSTKKGTQKTSLKILDWEKLQDLNPKYFTETRMKKLES